MAHDGAADDSLARLPSPDAVADGGVAVGPRRSGSAPALAVAAGRRTSDGALSAVRLARPGSHTTAAPRTAALPRLPPFAKAPQTTPDEVCVRLVCRERSDIRRCR